MRSALVTGATRGIGRAVSRMLAAEGYRLYLNSRTYPELVAFCASLQAEFNVPCTPLCADVGDYTAVESFFREQISSLDVLVNNAGIAYFGLLQDMQESDWDRVLNADLKSVFNVTRQALPLMLHEHRGVIVNISSVWGITGASMEVAYSAAKGGVNAFTRALARETAPSGIRVNAIAAGVIDTAMNGHLSEQEKTDLQEQIGLGRFGTPEDVAAMVRYLISDEAAYLTGQVIPLDGSFI